MPCTNARERQALERAGSPGARQFTRAGAPADKSHTDLPLLALLGDAPAGLAWGKIDPVHPSVAHTYQMWVAPTHRHLGIGGAILEALIVWARSRNAKQVVLSVTCGDSPARRLYERVGFLPGGDPKPLGTGATLMAQELELNLVGP